LCGEKKTVFGPSIPANFETGDPLNPIDWSKVDCANPFASDCSHCSHCSRTASYLLLFLIFTLSLMSYGIYQAIVLLETIKGLFQKKKHLVAELWAQPLLNKKTIFILTVILLVIVVCYIYWTYPESIEKSRVGFCARIRFENCVFYV
jgi:hypothetical protein